MQLCGVASVENEPTSGRSFKKGASYEGHHHFLGSLDANALQGRWLRVDQYTIQRVPKCSIHLLLTSSCCVSNYTRRASDRDRS
jgi:hypothetical protein